MRLFLLFCLLAAGAPLLASAQFYCMTGIPCGTGCTMGDGRCINGRCFDRDGRVEWQCMAPMMGTPGPFRLQGHDTQPQPWAAAGAATAASRQQQPQPQPQQQKPQDLDWEPMAPLEWKAQVWMPRMPTWQPWSFNPFSSSFSFWKPWAPIPMAPTPFGPMAGPLFSQDCGGKGPCAKGQFCDPQGVCRADDCESQFKHGCPGDKGELKKVGCPHFSGFKECYASTSEGFRCFKGPSGRSISCATQAGNMGGAVWTSSSGFQGPFGGWDEEEEDATEVKQPAAAAAKPPVAPATPAPAATPSTPAAAAVKPQAPQAAAAKKPESQAQGAASSAAGPAAAATSEDGSSKQSAFKKVAVEAGPAQAAAAASTSEPKKSLKGNPNLLVQGAQQLPPGARMGPMFGPDGTTMMAAGPGPALGMVDVDPAGRGVAAGMAAGDQKTVVTRRGPNGMSTMSSSVSNNGGPAIASSVATSGPASDQHMMPQGWDQPPQQGGSSAAAAPEATGRPATAASSREGTARDSAAGADASRPTQAAVKSAAGSGLRGALGVWQAAAAGAAVLLLLL